MQRGEEICIAEIGTWATTPPMLCKRAPSFRKVVVAQQERVCGVWWPAVGHNGARAGPLYQSSLFLPSRFRKGLRVASVPEVL